MMLAGLMESTAWSGEDIVELLPALLPSKRVSPISYPPALALKAASSFSPCMSLAVFEPPPPSVEPRASEFLCEPLKRNTWNSRSRVFHLDAIPDCFSQPDVNGNSSSRHWCPGVGSQVWAGTLCSPGGTSACEITLLILNCHTMDMGLACSAAPSLLLFSPWLLLYILSYKTSVQLSPQVVLSDDCSVI